MFKNIISRFFQRRHYWRTVGFEELSELYISMLFRSLAFSLVGIFVPIFLFKSGYQLTDIMAFYAVLFSVKVPFSFVSARIIARVGPKHAIALAYLLQVVPLGMLVTLQARGWPLWLIAASWGISNSLFFIAFHVDFSKVKHAGHGGKEVGWMTILEKGGALLGPLLGGLIATFVGAEYAFAAALGMFVLATIPLLLTAEPVKTRQRLDFGSFSVQVIWRDIAALSAMNVENVIVMVIWPLFVALYVFADNTYALVGLVTSISVLFSMLSARLIGGIIDNRKGRVLLRGSAQLAAAVNLLRLLAGSFGAVVVINILSELSTNGFKLPLLKSYYDRADDFPGHRIVFISGVEAASNMAKALVFWLLFVLAGGLAPRLVFVAAFMLASLASLLILTERFPALNTESRRGEP